MLDALNVEMDGEQYDSVAAATADVALCSVEGGGDYYNYLLQKYSGVDGAWGDFRETLANEANGNYQVMNDCIICVCIIRCLLCKACCAYLKR